MHRLFEAPPEADRDQQVLVGEQIDLVQQVAGAADRRFGIEADRHQAVGQEPRQRRREIHADHEDSPRAVDLRRQRDDAIGVERRLEDAEVLAVAIEAVFDVAADAALLLRGRLGHRVRRDLPDEMLAEIGREVGKALVAEGLDGADDGGGVDAVAPRQLARRQEIGFLRVVEDRPHQLPALAAQLGPREAHLERRARCVPGSRVPRLAVARVVRSEFIWPFRLPRRTLAHAIAAVQRLLLFC